MRAVAGVMAAFLVAGSAMAQQRPDTSGLKDALEFVHAHSEKHEYRIPMRDGVKLYAAVWVPKDGFADKGPYPILMTKTPYSCGGYDSDKTLPRVTGNVALLRSGYILVCEDVRGRWASEGEWLEMTPSRDGKGVDESTDMSDTVDWLLKNVPNNNGRVGIMGISYGGFYTAASIVDSNPAIKAASPQAPIIDLWMGDDAYHGGAFMLLANHTFYASFFHPQKTPLKVDLEKGYKFPEDMYSWYLQPGHNTIASLDTPELHTSWLLHDQLVNTTYNSYWQARNMAAHMHGVKAAVLDVGGWFDAEDLSGPVRVFHAIDKLSPQAPENTLVEGPWVHGGWSRSQGDKLGDISFGSATAQFYRDNIEAPFFEHWLKDKAWTPLPKAYTFETGTNVWKKYDAWPPRSAQVRTLYLQANGGLSWSAPKEKASKTEYVSDPNHPVPFTAGDSGTDVPQRYMDDDQRFVSGRKDVVTFVSAPLTEDVTIAGPIKPHLKIASTGTDSDFDVKLIDVFPDDEADAKLRGYQMLIRGEPFRAKFRNSWEKPEPLAPGKKTSVDFTMQDVNHTFQRGHRIMVEVQSSWFPLVDRNPQVFEDIAKAKPEDFKPATETVFHQADAASGVEVMVLPK
jgi:hypothetical protein